REGGLWPTASSGVSPVCSSKPDAGRARFTLSKRTRRVYSFFPDGAERQENKGKLTGAPSRARSLDLVARPPCAENPPGLPPAAATRWQGMRIGTGFFAMARPTSNRGSSPWKVHPSNCPYFL